MSPEWVLVDGRWRRLVVALALVLLTTAVAGAGSPAPAALADSPTAAYSGSVDTADSTGSLTGSGPVTVTIGNGVLSHSNLGANFDGPTDFDSGAAGVQTVPDTGGWTVNVSGQGSDGLEIDEGEATTSVSYAFGH